MSTTKPREGYLFHPSECPNRDHPASMTGTCGLCGVNVSAYRFGQGLAKWCFTLLLLAVAAVVAVVISGCAPRESTPEDRYLNAVYAAAKQEGVTWTADLQEVTATFGQEVCASLAAGESLPSIRIASAQSDPAQDRLIQAAITAADEHLCEE